MPIIIGKGTFGANSSKEGAQRVTKTSSVTETVALDKDGEVIGVVLLQETQETEYEMLFLPGETVPKIGDSYEGGIVTGVTEQSSNTECRKYTVRVKTWGSVGGGASS